MRGARSLRDGENGFTLLEILVGLVISSLIMVGLSLAMKTINMGFEQTTGSIGRQAAITTGLYIVAEDISRIERVFDNPGQPGAFLFSGGPGEAVYIMAERPGNNRAGVYWVRLLVRRTADGAELVRMRAPFDPDKTSMTDVEWSDEVVLMRGNLAIALSYRAPRAGLREWAGSWQARDMLPGEIKIEITDLRTGRLRTPVFVQSLKIGAEADCVVTELPDCTMNSGGTIAGGGRTQ